MPALVYCKCHGEKELHIMCRRISDDFNIESGIISGFRLFVNEKCIQGILYIFNAVISVSTISTNK